MSGSVDNSFEANPLYKIIRENNIKEWKKYISSDKTEAGYRILSRKGETYLHIAIENKCHLDIIRELIPRVRLGQRNESSKTAFELANESKDQNAYIISQYHQDFILDCIKNGKYPVIKELALDGWAYWPVKGMPEIEQFKEAPMYLSGMFGNLSHCGTPNLISKTQLPQLLKKATVEQMVQLTKRRDVLGMTILHLAILFRDFEAVTRLLKCPEYPEMLEVQDNMGRTPLHYAYSFNEASELRIQIEIACEEFQALYNIVDKAGFTPLDYSQKKAKLETKKLVNLYTLLLKSVELYDFIYSIIGPGSYNPVFFPDREELITTMMMAFNTHGEPLIDGTGRNILHKVVIGLDDDDYNLESHIKDLLSCDKEGKLFKGRDLWGRTPLHYAYAFNRKALNLLLTKRSNISPQLINEVKEMKDFDGKTVDDFHMKEKDALKLKGNLRKTFKLISLLALLPVGQEIMLKQILKKAEFSDSNADNIGDIKDLYESTSMINVLENCDNELKNLCLYAKCFTGVPLLHYIVALEDMELFHSKVDDDDVVIEDNMKRNLIHYLMGVPNDNKVKQNACFDDSEDEDDEDDLLQNSDDIEEYNIFSSDGDSDSVSDSSDDDNKSINKPNVKNEKDIKKNIHPMLRLDLHGKKPRDYKGKNPQFCNTKWIEEKIGACFHTSLTTVVNPYRSSMVNQKSSLSDNGVHKQNKIPQTSRPKFSADKRQPMQPTFSSSPPLDTEYLKKALGVALTGGLSVISLIQPADPIEYLAQYLYKHADNLQYQKKKEETEKMLALEMESAEQEENKRKEIKYEQKLIQEQQRMKSAETVKFTDKIIKEEEE